MYNPLILLARPTGGADYTTKPQYFLKNLACLPSV